MTRKLALLIAIVVTIVDEISANLTNVSLEESFPECRDGLMLSAWRPKSNLSGGERFARGIAYFIVLCYLFLGVSIVSDRFMAAIEMITSQEKEVKIKQNNGETQVVVVRVWNETVANLSLMALGTSAPEILLSIIEMFAKNFEAGELGPGTIVGSAAFNLFVIPALCMVIIPDGEVRRIKHLRVFFVTTVWSIFAYVWLYLILAKFSPGRLEVWEGLLTFLFFPLTILTAYIADRRLLIYKYLDKDYRMNKRGVIVSSEGAAGDVEMNIDRFQTKTFGESAIEPDTEDAKSFEESRRAFMVLLKDIRQKYPQRNIEDIEKMALEQLLERAPKSRAFYRMQGTRALTRGVNISKKLIQARAESDLDEIKAEIRRSQSKDSASDDRMIGSIAFSPGHYTVLENCGQVELTVVRKGGLWQTDSVEYVTEDGTAEAGSDYGYAKGILVFQPGVDEQRIKIDIIDDDVFECDEYFYVRLSNNTDSVVLGTPDVATVMILDDDHSGYFTLAEKKHEMIESVGRYELIVKRLSGARGAVLVPYWTEDGTAKAGKDYEMQRGKLEFKNNEIEKIISLGILEEGSYEKDVLFYVNLGEPQMVEDDELAALIQAAEAKAPEDLTEEDKMALLGRPKAGDIVRAQLRIKESKEFKNTVDKLVQRANASLLIGTSSWKEQFTEALTVSPGGDDNEDYEDGEEPKPSCGDYVMHFLTLFWKLIFAFIPPTDISGGYLCFVVSIFCIGVVTAVIGDVASHFGCTLGIKDSVTAIIFVALGTSIPDTFASKVAAIQDKYADASVGNVTGSNAVNVFLGIGVAWTIAAIYHEINGTSFDVEPGNLAFSVTLFCSEALIAISVLLFRRSKAIGGELGGPKGIKYLSGSILLGLWFIYLIMSTLEAYHVIPGF